MLVLNNLLTEEAELSTNEDQSSKETAEMKKTDESCSAKPSVDEQSQTTAAASTSDSIETKIKPKHHTGLTQQLGLPLSQSDETSKKYSDVVNEYQALRKRNLAESGISQAFGALLPKSKTEDEQKDDEGWKTWKSEDKK